MWISTASNGTRILIYPQLLFHSLKFDRIIGKTFRNDVVDVKTADIEKLSCVGTLLFVGQPQGLSLGSTKFLAGHGVLDP